MPAPRLRATYLKMAIAGIKRRDDVEREELFAEIGDAARGEIRAATLLSWVGVEPYLAVTRALHRILGGTRARRFWNDHLTEGFDRPLIRPIRAGAVALHGRSPASLIRCAPQAWALVAKGCGTPRCDITGNGSARVTFLDIPAVLRNEPSVLDVWAGNLQATIEYFDATGSVEVDQRDLDAGRVAFDMKWS